MLLRRRHKTEVDTSTPTKKVEEKKVATKPKSAKKTVPKKKVKSDDKSK